jgi:hypothetical protein
MVTKNANYDRERILAGVDTTTGRRRKLTPEMIDFAVAMIEHGNYINTTSDAMGIHEDTFHGWLKRGEIEQEGIDEGILEEKDASIFNRFYRAIKKANAKAEAHLLHGIEDVGMSGEWTALAWILERRFSKNWGRKIEVTTADDTVRDPFLAMLDRLKDAKADREEGAPDMEAEADGEQEEETRDSDDSDL